MKNKIINSKIAGLGNRIKSIKSKAENAKNLNESGVFKTLESDLEAATVLQKEIQTLKESVKAKTQELKEGISKLRKSSKDAGKVLKKEKNAIKSSDKGKARKEKSPVISKIPDSKNKAVQSRKKPARSKK